MDETSTIGNVTAPKFLTLPTRTPKPRTSGLTHVIDKGASAATTQSVLDAAAAHIDIWKFGWGTAYVDANLGAKLGLLADAGIRACIGGTLMEIAWAQGRADECLAWAEQVGFESVEISRGVAPMSLAEKHDLIARAARRFVVLSEVGSKDPNTDLSLADWTSEVAADLAAGSSWVIAEGRESGTVGVFRPDGSVREDIIAAALRGGSLQQVLFETPRKDQQAWFIREFGVDVNLANIALDDALALETLRLGLRADTCDVTRRTVSA